MGLPPTSSKLSSDANEVTTFKFDFPNFTGTHTATDLTLGVNAVAGGGTSVAFLPVNNVFLGNGTSTPSFVAPGTSGNVLTSDGTTWTSVANPGTGAITQLTGDVTATGPGVVPATVASVGGSSAASVGAAAVAIAAATSADTPNTLVLRDGSGNFSAGTITASLTGHASLDVPLSEVGQPNGVASLDPSGKVPASQLSATLLEYKGNWNSATNSPTLVDGTGTNGDTYRVSVASTGPDSGLNDPSMVNFSVGNLIIYSSALAVWQQTGSVTGVTSVNGAVGTVTVNAINQLTGDVTAGPASGSASAVATLTAVTNSTLATLSALSLPVSQLTGVLPVPNGGTGASSFNAFSIPLTGTTTTGAFTDTGPGTAGQILTSNGASAFPTWQAAPSMGTNGGAGTILSFGGTVIPTGFVICDGASYLISTYPALAAALFDISTGNYAYGSIDPTHFNVPNLQGYFLRGTDNGAGNDPDTSSRTASAIGGNTGDNVGSLQGNTTAVNGLSVTGSGFSTPSVDPTITGGSTGQAIGSQFISSTGGTVNSGSIGLTGNTETRPKNIYVNFIIQTVPGTSGGGGSSYTFADSLVNTAGTVTLVGDTASPGASQYYGTNASSILGYYPLSGGSGSVTSVALSDGSTTPIYAISGSPVTSTGTLTFTLDTQNANTVFAGPSSGSAAQPTFRALVAADIPSVLTTAGDMLYEDATPAPARLPIGTMGQVLSVASGIPAWITPVGPTAFAVAFSTAITTSSSAVTSGTFTTFSNSPAFTFTPTISGTYKVYAGVPAEQDGSNTVGTIRIFNTSGSATLLAESQATLGLTGVGVFPTVPVQSVYTLVAGNSYVFDIQGKSSGTLTCNDVGGTFYMFAEGVGSTTVTSEIMVDTGLGVGSANTTVRTFTNNTINQGSNITYASDAVNGDSFTINTTGVYAISYSEVSAGNEDFFCITKNGTALSTNPGTITLGQGKIAVSVYIGNATSVNDCFTTLNCTAGDVIRAQTSNVNTANGNINTIFRITKLM